MAVWRRLALLACASWLAGCGAGDADAGGPTHGPPGGVIEVDAGEMTASGGSAAGGSGAGGGGGGDRLGEACGSTASCPSGAYCREDPIEYRAHQQCTAACTTAADCLVWGADTSCVLDGICVRRCASDSDCAPLTKCNLEGWCERAGPSCAGTPTPCSLLSAGECSLALGCSIQGDCSGYADSCYYQSSHSLCIRIDGCYWSSYSDKCSGSARSCGLYSGRYTCTGQPGCRWSESCEGTPLDCGTVGLEACTTQPGCQVMEQ